MKKPKNLEELFVYNKAMMLGEEVWKIVEEWDYFQKNSLGKQWVTSTDSIAANIEEGHGRFYYKENKLFCYYSRGSLFESKTWLKKARNRALLSEEKFNHLLGELNFEGAILSNYIKSIGQNP